MTRKLIHETNIYGIGLFFQQLVTMMQMISKISIEHFLCSLGSSCSAILESLEQTSVSVVVISCSSNKHMEEQQQNLMFFFGCSFFNIPLTCQLLMYQRTEKPTEGGVSLPQLLHLSTDLPHIPRPFRANPASRRCETTPLTAASSRS